MARNIFEREETYASWDEQFYQKVALHLYDRLVPLMATLLNVRSGDVILDAGCGVGVHSIRAAERGYRVHAMDISSVALVEARHRVKAAGIQEAIAFAQEDVRQLGLKSEIYDAIFSWGVIIHIPEVEQALDELVRVLKRRGRLALYITNSTAWDDKFRAVARAFLGKPATKRSRFQIGTGAWYDINGEKLWIWHFDIEVLTAHLEERGLRRILCIPGEFTQLHINCRGWLRRVMFHVNNIWSRLSLPAGPAAMNLLIFERY